MPDVKITLRSRTCLAGPFRLRDAWSGTVKTDNFYAKTGRLLIGACGTGLTLADMTIIGVGITVVFVPQDLTFMGIAECKFRLFRRC